MIVFKKIIRAKHDKRFHGLIKTNNITTTASVLLRQSVYFLSQSKSVFDVQNDDKNPLRKINTPLTIEEQLFQYASKLSVKSIEQQEQQNNKLESQKQAFIKEFYDVFNRANQYDFMSFLKQERNKLHYITPSQILMVTSTVENPQNVVELLSLIYPSYWQLSNEQLEVFFQKILAFKPRIKPNIPKPRQIEGIQSILVVLSQIYPNDLLIQWLKQVPLYKGQNLYVLSIGAFSIMQKLSKQSKKKYSQLLSKIQYKIQLMFLEQDSFDLKLGISILALQMNIYPLSIKLLDQIAQTIGQQIKMLDPYKLFLLFIALSKHKQTLEKQINAQSLKDLKNVYSVQKHQDQEKQLKFVKQTQMKLILHLNNFVWQKMIKLNILIDLWAILKYEYIQKEKKHHQWQKFSTKIQNVTASVNSINMLKQCSDQQLVEFVKIMDNHKINNQKLLKNILLVLAGRVQQMDKTILISLTKALVTYVRQCQSYLTDIYKIIIQRRSSFTDLQIEQINDAFGRVQVLFPRKIQ